MLGALLLLPSQVFLVCLLALLLGLCLGFWATWIAARKQKIDASLQDIISLSIECIRFLAGRMASNITAMMLSSGLIFGAVCFVAGWTTHDSADFRNSFVLTNAVIDNQNGQYVTYHFESDPTRHPRTLKFCEDYIPNFERKQIIEEMVYTRKNGCESIAGNKFSLTLRRVNGVPILEE